MRATPELNGIEWRKSSYSGGNQGDACVEVGVGVPGVVPVRDSKDPQGPVLTFTPSAWTAFLAEARDFSWHKSSYSGGDQGSECVEVGVGAPGVVPVRDSKDPQGPVLTFTPSAWTAFVTSVRDGGLPAR
jgi:F420-0:gamma-glutamyl ligase